MVVLERGALGAGASSRNAGQVLTGLKLEPAALVAKYGEARAKELFDISNRAIADGRAARRGRTDRLRADTNGTPSGGREAVHFAAFREEQALLARVFNHNVSVIPEADQATELGATSYYGLLLDQHSLALNPAKDVAGLAAAATRAGAVLAPHTAVQRVARTRGCGRSRRLPEPSRRKTSCSPPTATPTAPRRPCSGGSFPSAAYIIVTAPLSN